MNTPTHIILSYALLRRFARTRMEHALILIGGFLPDITIYVLFFWAIIMGVPQQEVWSEIYFTHPLWQGWIDVFNSIPILLLLGAVAHLIKWRGGILLSASMLIHVLGDIFLHNDDAHRHFFPLSDWKFISPISYWDPAHYGWIGSIIECSILVLAVAYLWTHLKSKVAKYLIIFYVGISLVMLIVARFIL